MVPDRGQEGSLLRALGPGMAVAIVVGNVIGSGIFATPGQIAEVGRSFPLIISAWVMGGVLSLLGALCFAELGALRPRAGGMYVYLKEAYGRPVGFLQGWNQFLFGNPASLGALSMIFVDHLGVVCGYRFTTLVAVLIGVGMIAGLAGINVLGVLWGGWMQTATTIIKAGFVLFVAVLPFVIHRGAASGFDSGLLGQDLPLGPDADAISTRFAVVLLSVMWAYNGWHGVTPVAEEIRDPKKNIPRALMIGIGLLTVLYVSANVAYHGVVPLSEMAAEENQKKVAVLMFDRLLGDWGGQLMAVGVMVSTFGAINSNLLLGPRVPFAMGRDDLLLQKLGAVHPRFRTPARAICVQAVMGVVLLLLSALLVEWVDSLQSRAGSISGVEKWFVGALEKRSIFEILTTFIIFSASIFYMFAVLSVLVLRRTVPDEPRPFRVWIIVPVFYLVFYAWFLSHVFLASPVESIAGIVLTLTGVPVLLAGAGRIRKQVAQSGESTRDGDDR